MIKLVFGSKNKIIKLQKATFQGLNSLIKQTFADIPLDYSLSYLDSDKDQICLNSDQDLHIMLNSGIKINKIYIKQSLSQVIEITDRIEPSFEIYQHKIEEPPLKNDIVLVEKQEKIIQQVVPKVQIEEVSEVRQEEQKVIIQQRKQEQRQEAQESKPVEAEPATNVEVEMVEEPANLSFSKTNKIEIQEGLLEQKIAEAVKKIMIQKQEEQKAHQQRLKEQALKEQAKKKVEEIEKVEKTEIKVKQQMKPQVEKRQVRELKKEQKKENAPVKKVEEKPFLRKDNNISQLIYHGVICAGCKDEYGIFGIRYQCIFCDNYSICSNCEETINHEHALLKVKLPKQAVTKDQIISKYKTQIFASQPLPNGHYVPSISKKEAQNYIDAGKKIMQQSLDRTNNLVKDLFLKLEMSHQNPYEMKKPILPPPKREDFKEKVQYLVESLEITDNEARQFIKNHFGFTKEQLVNIYFQKKSK